MSLENFNKPNNEKKTESLMISAGVDKDGTVLYETWDRPLPEFVSTIPPEVFREVTADFNGLPEINKPMKFHQGEYLSLAINSDIL